MNQRQLVLLLCRLWLLPALLVLLLLCPTMPLAPPPAAAQSAAPALTVEATPAFGGNYTPGTWLPVSLLLANQGADTTVRAVAHLPGATSQYSLLVALPQGAEKQVTLLVPMEQLTRVLLLSVVPLPAAASDALQPAPAPAPIELEPTLRPRPNERLLGLVSEQPLRLRLPRRQDMARLPFVPIPLALDELPAAAPGLSSLGLLLLHDVDTSLLSADQQQAMLAWVVNGGHLIIGGGLENRRTLAGLLPALKLATLGPPTELTLLDQETPAQGIDSPLPPLLTLSGSRLEPLAGVASRPGPAAFDTPLWLQKQVGDGMITQLAFHPGLRMLQTWEGAPVFWNSLLQPALLSESLFGMQTSRDALQEGHLAQTVGYLPRMHLPPTRLLFALLVCYIVLVGPGLALVLRRTDRQPLVWVVLPVVALLTTGLTFGFAASQRSSQQLVAQASLVEYLGNGQARVRTAISLLSPRPAVLRLHAPPDTLVRPLRNQTTVAGELRRAAGSFQQADAASVGGTAGATAQVALDDWQLAGVLADAIVPLNAPTARLHVAGNRVQAVITNTTAYTLSDTLLVYGSEVGTLGAVAPGETASVPWPTFVDRSGDPLAALDVSRVQKHLARAALVSPLQQQRTPRPVLLAWIAPGQDAASNQPPPLPVTVASEGAAVRQTTLLVVPVDLVSGRSEHADPAADEDAADEDAADAASDVQAHSLINLPVVWLRPDFARIRDASFCMMGHRQGVQPTTNPAHIWLHAPPAFTAMQPLTLTLTLLDSAGEAVPEGITSDLFNWQQGTWQPVERSANTGASRTLLPPVYVQQGTVLLRLAGSNLVGSGCVLPSVSINGRQPEP